MADKIVFMAKRCSSALPQDPLLLRHLRAEVSLATHYVKNQGHLIGQDVEIWEFDLDAKQAARLL